MPLRIQISADEFGCGTPSADPDEYPKMNESYVTVPFNKLEEFITNLRRVADELEAKQTKGGW